jgi:hypothetical protein
MEKDKTFGGGGHAVQALADRVTEWVGEYSHLLHDEMSIGADLDYFFDDNQPRSIGLAIQAFVAASAQLAKRDSKNGILLVVPLARRGKLVGPFPDLSKLRDQPWGSDRLPTLYMARREAMDRFENVEQLLQPLAWSSAPEGACAYLRVWRSADAGSNEEFDCALYVRHFPGDGEGLSFWYGLPPA